MLIKFFGGTGGGSGIANYLVDPDRQGRQNAAPEVLRGDIAQTRELIDSSDRKWTYSTGVLSFAPEDRPTEAQQTALMDDFERLAFAGLQRDQYDITWVRHSHTQGGRVELHFLTPRMELASGKAFNIAPPGWERSYAPLRDTYNFEYGWARPDDPARARTQQQMSEAPIRGETRDSVTAYLEGKILTGEIENRADIVAALHEAGLETPRQGQNYITAMDPDTGDRWRLKGRIYEKDWTRDAELDRGAARESQGSEGAVGDKDERRAAQSRERLEAVITRRAEWVRERYPATTLGDSERHQREEPTDQGRDERDQRQTEKGDRDQHADRRDDVGVDDGGSRDLDDLATEKRNGRADDGRDVSDPAGERRTRLDLWNAALRKIGGMNVGEPDSDRKSALARIRELGSSIREYGTSAITIVRSFFGRDEGASRPSEPARGALAASERSLAETEQTNDRLDREGETLERQIKVKDELALLGRELERNRQPQYHR
ncbi:hypothetical protein FHS72_001898 [Loktanella ponticola]|uniref:Mobilization relaxase n=1 Tax=Yoonia ponticola TaxID=1524255 RepID=A0A7W9EY12_9RHOB|nr:relaxase/mobilization nuclease domain-containing protein [Yoonia ponticola]MBB5722272.1 hypothetical protein [Yoonia ponticola]